MLELVEISPKKVGIIPCNGEELPEGTLTRLACRKVLDKLKPSNTVTICLPLFIAGGKEEREFARKFPTITVDGCDKQCGRINTERTTISIPFAREPAAPTGETAIPGGRPPS